jgi:hypothetical protein
MGRRTVHPEGASMNRRDVEDALRKEVKDWPGVTLEFAEGGKHPKAKYWFAGKMLARPYPSTPSDSAFGIHNMLGEHRRVLKQLGAIRNKPEPSKDDDEAPYRKPNNGAAERGNHTPGEKAGPKADVIDQLVDAGIAKPDAADVARAEKVLAGVERAPAVEAQPAIAQPVGVSDEPAERLIKELQARGFELQVVGAVTRGSVIMTAAAMIRDGIYFGLPMEVYRNVPRLGAGSLVDLNKSPGDFWAGSWLDPDRKDESDEDKKAWAIVGEAYHCARLEPDQFEKRFCRKPTKADYAEQAAKFGACWNGTDVGNKLGELGTTKKRADENVAEQGQRLEGEGYGGVIWPLIEARAKAEQGDRIALDGKVWDDIARDMERLRGSKEIASKFTDHGASEVSVFWIDENNIQRKARFDRLEPDYWLDFKTFDNSRGKRLEQAINDAIRYNRYYITAASYHDAYEALRQLEIVGEATDQERHLFARIQISPKEPRCWFIFQQKSGIPNLLAREFVFHDVPDAIENSWDTGADDEAVARGHEATRRPTQIYAKGRSEIDYAKRLFALYAGVYAPGEPWAPLEPVAKISDMDFSAGWLEGRYE